MRLDRRRGLQSANWFAMLTNAQAEAGRILDQLADSAEVRALLDMDALQRLYQDWPAPSASFGPLEYRTSLLRGLMVGVFIRSCAPDHDARARNAPTTLGKPQL